MDFVVVGLGVGLSLGLVVVIDLGCGFLGSWWWWVVADLGFVVRLWWVVASKRCIWLVGVVVAEALYLRRERRSGRERKRQGRIKKKPYI